jgi:hypothetical protein
MSEHVEEKAEPDETNLGKPSLWFGIIGSSMVWLTQFLINYALVPYVCHTRKFFSFHLTSLIALILVSAAGVICWREWVESGLKAPQSEDGGRIGTTRLTAIVGLLTSVLTFLLIVGQAMATFMVDPCTN